MKKLTPGRQPRHNYRLAFIKLRPRVRRPPPLTHRLLSSWNMQHIRCLLQFSTTKMMQHMHPRCGLVRDKLAEGDDNEEWTPKRLMGITEILGSLFLRHDWCMMLLPRKISADKEEKTTNDKEQSKKGSWLTRTKPPTDEIAPLHATPWIQIGTTSCKIRDLLISKQ
jgi:hypothetical protein